MSVSQTESLKRKIIDAFADVSYPKGFITRHECDECFAVRKSFLNKDWRQIEPETLEENYDKLPLFAPEAFHCFLPAFLIYSLDNFNDNLVCKFTIYTLSPSRKNVEESLNYWQHRFEDFTLEQLNLIYEFLSLVESKEDDDFYMYREQVETGRKVLKEFIEPTLRK